MKHIDLFSGIGGFSLACEWAGIETILFVEIDKFCQKVLNKHWANVPIVENVNNVKEIKQVIANTRQQSKRGKNKSEQSSSDFAGCNCREVSKTITNTTQFRDSSISLRGCDSEYKELQREFGGSDRQSNDAKLLLTAGFPCQPFSNAGRKRGSSDSRYLWPQTLAVIEAVKPSWIILENVPGILNMVFPDSETRVASQTSFCEVPNDEISDYDTIPGRIERDLIQAGYETVWLVIPACSLNAPHRRDRVWIVANANSRRGIWTKRIRKDDLRGEKTEESDYNTIKANKRCGLIANNSNNGCNSRTTLGKGRQSKTTKVRQAEENKQGREGWFSISRKTDAIITNSNIEGLQGQFQPNSNQERQKPRDQQLERQYRAIPNWEENWYEVATKFCRVDARIPLELDFIGGLNKYFNDKKSKPEIRDIERQVLCEMWKHRELAKTSPNLFAQQLYNFVSGMPHKGTHGRWFLGKGIEKDGELRDLWERFYAQRQSSSQDLQHELLECLGKVKCNETVANRVDRLKSLGNAIVPQVALQLIKIIKEIDELEQ